MSPICCHLTSQSTFINFRAPEQNGRGDSKSSAQPRRRALTFALPPSRPHPRVPSSSEPPTVWRWASARGALAPPPRTALRPRPRAARRVHIVHGREPRDGHGSPPGARGGADGAKGSVELILRHLEWNLRGAPPWVRVAARWWGDEGVEKSKRPWVRLVPGADASFAFPVKAKPSGFSRYCRDAVAVVLEFSDGRTGRRIAAASVDVSRLDVRQPVDVHVPLLSRGRDARTSPRASRRRLPPGRRLVVRTQRTPREDRRRASTRAQPARTHPENRSRAETKSERSEPEPQRDADGGESVPRRGRAGRVHVVVRRADHAATPDAAGVHARRVRTRPFGIAGETRDEDPARGFRETLREGKRDERRDAPVIVDASAGGSAAPRGEAFEGARFGGGGT